MAYIYPEKLKYQTYRAPLPQAHTAIPPNPKSSVPTTATGSEMGRTSRDYYNAAFPGTTPWERLGNSGGAQAATAGNTAKIQSATQLEVAKIHGKTARDVTQIQGQNQLATVQKQGGETRITQGVQHAFERTIAEYQQKQANYRAQLQASTAKKARKQSLFGKIFSAVTGFAAAFVPGGSAIAGGLLAVANAFAGGSPSSGYTAPAEATEKQAGMRKIIGETSLISNRWQQLSADIKLTNAQADSVSQQLPQIMQKLQVEIKQGRVNLKHANETLVNRIYSVYQQTGLNEAQLQTLKAGLPVILERARQADKVVASEIAKNVSSVMGAATYIGGKLQNLGDTDKTSAPGAENDDNIGP